MSRKTRRPKRAPNRAGSVSPRSDGRGFTISVTGVDGKRKTYTRKTEGAAEQLRQMLLATIEREEVLTTNRQTVAQFLAAWLKDVKSVTLTPNSLWSYEERCDLMGEHIGSIPLVDLHPEHIQRMYADLRRAHYSPSTVHHAHTILRGALKHAARLKYIASNPTDDVEAPRPQIVEPETLTAEQASTLLETTVGTRWHALWYMLLGSAARFGEISALYWGDLGDEIMIKRTVSQGKGVGMYVKDRPKTQGSRRPIVVTAGMQRALDAHRQILIEDGLPVIGKAALIFPGTRGQLLTACSAGNALKRDLAAAGAPIVTIHALRHTGATILTGANVQLRTVQGVLGHRQLSTTQRYAHLAPAPHRAAIETLDSLIAPKAQKKEETG